MTKKEHETKKIKKPWPTKDAMEQIYEMNLWGSDSSKFYSGTGSHRPEIVIPYIKALTSFLTSFTTPLILCDLGCGDFNIGKQLVQYTRKYIAVDIVADLIAYNKEKFRQENLEFYCLDIATDDLPSGECALIRQVLQHLSNDGVQHIVRKLANFKYVVVTEHLPEGDFIPNKEIISGQWIRLNKHSGVNFLAPPFNFELIDEKRLASITLNEGKGVIVTNLYRVF